MKICAEAPDGIAGQERFSHRLVIRNGTVVTAADTVVCDVAIRDGRIVALGEALSHGHREIDATGRYVLPGGVDAHCHLDQPMGPGLKMADDFETGARTAAVQRR